MPFAAAATAAAVGGAALQSISANKALKAQTAGANASLREQQRQYDLGREDLAPYRNIGTNALYSLSDLLGINRDAPMSPEEIARGDYGKGRKGEQKYQDAMGQYNKDLSKYNTDLEAFNSRKTGIDAFTADPGYQFRLDQGNRAIENQARAAGRYYSPSTVKELTRYGQDFASNEFGNVANRLSGIAGVGQSATNTGVQLGQNYANNYGNTMTELGNARGAASIAQGNAWGNAFGTVGNMFNQNQIMKRMGY